MKIISFASAAIAAVLLPASGVALIIDVPDDQPTIQAGIDAASAGDTVRVAPGTYYEHDIEVKSGICIASETGQADCVTVDAESEGRVFICMGVDASTSVVGLTITGGMAAIPSDDYGAGMYLDDASPSLTRCDFVFNIASYGGGMSCRNGSSPTLTECLFQNNVGVFGGGGLYCLDHSDPTLADCVFLWGLTSFGDGGGVSCSSYSSPSLRHCLFIGNFAGGLGGALICDEHSAAELTNCTMWGSGASGGGGVIACGSSSSASLANCIIAFSESGEAVYCAEDGAAVLSCCDLYANPGGDWVGCIADQYGVDGNLSEDPLFCAMGDHDFTLCSNSPCRPEGNSCLALIGALGVACPDCSTPAEGHSWGSIKAMFRPR